MCGKRRRDGFKNEWVLNECGQYRQVNYHYVRNVLRCLGEAYRENEWRVNCKTNIWRVNGLGEDEYLESYEWEGTDEILKKRIVRSLENKRQNINGNSGSKDGLKE